MHKGVAFGRVYIQMSQTLSQPAIVSAAAASPAPRTSSRLARWVPRVALILILGAYALFLYTHFAPAISTPDSNGYWAQASLIAKTGRSWFIPEAETQYIGMHWLIAPAGQYISRYPPGLPAMVAVVYALAVMANVLVPHTLVKVRRRRRPPPPAAARGCRWHVVSDVTAARGPGRKVHTARG